MIVIVMVVVGDNRDFVFCITSLALISCWATAGGLMMMSLVSEKGAGVLKVDVRIIWFSMCIKGCRHMIRSKN
jgi:hypothetical protein